MNAIGKFHSLFLLDWLAMRKHHLGSAMLKPRKGIWIEVYLALPISPADQIWLGRQDPSLLTKLNFAMEAYFSAKKL